MNTSRILWPGGLGRDHRNIYVVGRNNGFEVNVETVREHERLAGQQMWQYGLPVHLCLNVVGNQHHDDVRLAGGVLDQSDPQAVGLGLCNAAAALVQSDHHVLIGVFQVERVRVSLAAISDYAYGLVLYQGHVRVVLVVHLSHVVRSLVLGC